MNERQTGYVDARTKLAALITARDAPTRKRNALTHQIAYWRDRLKMESLEESLGVFPDISPEVSLEKEEKEKKQKNKEEKVFEFSSSSNSRAAAPKAAAEEDEEGFDLNPPTDGEVRAFATNTCPLDPEAVEAWLETAKKNAWHLPNGTRITRANFRAMLRGFEKAHLARRAQARAKDADEDPEQALERSRRKAIDAIVKKFCHG